MQSIGNSSFFSNMSQDMMHDLVKLLHPKFLVQDENLFSTGDASSEFYIARSGDITSTKTLWPNKPGPI